LLDDVGRGETQTVNESTVSYLCQCVVVHGVVQWSACVQSTKAVCSALAWYLCGIVGSFNIIEEAAIGTSAEGEHIHRSTHFFIPNTDGSIQPGVQLGSWRTSARTGYHVRSSSMGAPQKLYPQPPLAFLA
jgi:hypothetical protein